MFLYGEEIKCENGKMILDLINVSKQIQFDTLVKHCIHLFSSILEKKPELAQECAEYSIEKKISETKLICFWKLKEQKFISSSMKKKNPEFISEWEDFVENP